MSGNDSEAGNLALARLLATFEAHIADSSAEIFSSLHVEFTDIRRAWREFYSPAEIENMIRFLIVGIEAREGKLSDDAVEALNHGRNPLPIVGKSGDLMSFRNSLERMVQL